MNNEEYQETQEQVKMIAGLVRSLPLREFIAAGEKANAVGPIVDPTLWIKGHESLEQVLGIARSLRKVQNLVGEPSMLE